MKKLLAMLLALIMALSVLTVAAFAQSDTGSDTVDEPEDSDTVDVTEPEPEPAVDENPKTGLALCAIPMVVAGAAVAFAKKH